MKVLVTGASGFTGRSMVRFLASRQDISITGLARKNHPGLDQMPGLSWVFADILDPVTLTTTILSADPDAVVHLAGLTRGPLPELRTANVEGTKNLLDAVIRTNSVCPIVVVSSSAVYGYAGTTPIQETRDLTPVSEYGISKTEQESLCSHYTKTRDCRIAVARPFNLVGPDQPASFVCGRIIRQVIEIEQGCRDALDLLETGSSRDFIDVRDIVQGYWALLSHPEFMSVCAGKAFNLGSGRPASISGVLQIIETITGDHYPVRLPKDPPSIPVPYQQADNARIYAAAGWRPALSLSDSLHDMLSAARKQAGLQ